MIDPGEDDGIPGYSHMNAADSHLPSELLVRPAKHGRFLEVMNHREQRAVTSRFAVEVVEGIHILVG